MVDRGGGGECGSILLKHRKIERKKKLEYFIYHRKGDERRRKPFRVYMEAKGMDIGEHDAFEMDLFFFCSSTLTLSEDVR